MLRVLAPLLALLVLTLATPASAQRLGYLRASDPTGLSVAREELELRCRASDPRAITCAIVARWELRNAGESGRQPELMMSWSGTPTSVEFRVGEAVLATEIPTTRGVRVLVPAQGSVVVELRAEQELPAYVGFAPGSDLPTLLDPHDPLAARHPLLATRWEIVRRGLAWVRPSDIHFDSIGPTTVRVHPIEGWEVVPHTDRPIDDRTEEGVRTLTWEPSDRDGSIARIVGIELAHGIHTDVLRHGGPFLGLGGTIGDGSPGAFHGRLGYEVGLGEWVLVSVMVDTDFVRQVVLAPLLEVATYSVLVGPSLSIGAGVPIEVAPTTRAGLRVEASATFYSLAFVASLDYWPNDGTFQMHLLGRVGL